MKNTNYFGYDINILIISDRLPDYAESLCEFFRKYKNIQCSYIKSVDEFEPTKTGIPDFLLAAGYFENDNNYRIIGRVRAANTAVYCICLGILDPCTISNTSFYNFDDCFDRNLSHDKLLEHIKFLQEKRINGFYYYQNEISSYMLFENSLFEMTYDKDSDRECIIDLCDFGISTAGPSRFNRQSLSYVSTFQLENGVLTLCDLTIQNTHGIFLPINGVTPKLSQDNREYVYKNVGVPLTYTGEIIMKKGYRKVTKNTCSLLSKLFACEQLMRLTLKNGKVTECEDVSKMCEYVRKIIFFLPVLKYIGNLKPIHKRILTDNLFYLSGSYHNSYNSYKNYYKYKCPFSQKYFHSN